MALAIVLAGALGLLPEALGLLEGRPFVPRDAALRCLAILALFTLGAVGPRHAGEGGCIFPWAALILTAGLSTAAGFEVMEPRPELACVPLLALGALLLAVEATRPHKRGFAWRTGERLVLAAIGGALPILLEAIDSRFSEEEFFYLLQAASLALLIFLTLCAFGFLIGSTRPRRLHGLYFQRVWLWLALGGLAAGAFTLASGVYPSSFYSSNVLTHRGINRKVPFVRSKGVPALETFEGREVFEDILSLVASNPKKGPPEHGMLALARGDRAHAHDFRDSLLREARNERFAGPPHSVKWGQRLAALRVHYLGRVMERFPDLFSVQDMALLRAWMASINRRAFRAGWVDWLYAVAFTQWPQGPYSNQENGAGLLASLEKEKLASPRLSRDNVEFLGRKDLGWSARFRNTDDSDLYQGVWITNAWLQAERQGRPPGPNAALSFDWLLLQTLPDGTPPRVNHPDRYSIAPTAYLGAKLLRDPRLLWLAGKAVQAARQRGEPLWAQPGLESPVALIGTSPTDGSALLYGDSGLPGQEGPLAPDKVVLRDGWSEGSYLLLNLRFTGWHRLKATNSVSLLRWGNGEAREVLEGRSWAWLPAGRRETRDKRVYRESLNGLVVEKAGRSALLARFLGLGSPWAQDPPHYAEVVDFTTGQALDQSRTRLSGWHGWEHERRIFFYHGGGPVAVVDRARGPRGRCAALTWHLQGEWNWSEGRLVQAVGRDPAEVLLVPGEPAGLHLEEQRQPGRVDLLARSAGLGRLEAATVFLHGKWRGATASWDGQGRRRKLILRGSQGSLFLDVPEAAWIEVGSRG